MVGNKTLEERVHTLEKSMGTVVKALKEIKTEIKQLVDNGNKQQSEEIEEILVEQKVLNEIINRNVEAIERIDIEIARREKEVYDKENIRCLDQNCPHPKQRKFWQNNKNSCKSNLTCDFFHVTMARENVKNEALKAKYKCVSCKNVWEDRNCLVKHVIHGHETFFCLNCEDWVQFKTDVYNPNWTLFDDI